MRVLADSWYARELTGADALEDVIPAPLRGLAARNGIVRGVLLAGYGLRYDTVVTTNPSPGAAVATAVYGLLGRRRVVLLEYIVHPPAGGFAAIRFGVLRRRLLPRALRAAQVLTDSERPAYAALHGVPESRFSVIRWPRRFDDSPLPTRTGGRAVVATGRRADWETFLAAARGTDWDVTVVCTADDLARVHAAAAPGTVVRHDISQEEHQAVVDAATVYVLPLAETGASIGQIRVMNAAQAGVPVVASDVTGLQGYVDESTAALVPPGDPAALRRTVDVLLDDPDRRERLRRAAHGGGDTMADYLARIDELVHREG